MKIRIIFLSIAFLMPAIVSAQTVIKSGTDMKVKGLISAKGSILTSEGTDLTEAQLLLVGTNQTFSSVSPTRIQELRIDGGGVKALEGEWIITNSLVLTNGILQPARGKLIYVGSTTLSGNSNSFVNGILHQRGGGVRFYPIGAGSTYLPMSLNGVIDSNAEVGVTGFASGANLTLPVDVNTIASNRYWQLSVNGGTLNASSASLYIPGSSIDASQQLVVVEAEDANGGEATNLGGGITDEFVTSFAEITKPVLTIGIVEEVDLRIMDLITPFNMDDVNDQLKIVNVEYTFENKVTLVDRWGVPVKVWQNFRNYDDVNNPNSDGYDFGKLSPGNYICVLEYRLSAGAPLQKKNQMISVLKGN